MLREFAAFLCLFCLLSLVVELDGLAYVFGVASLGFFAIDLVLSDFARSPRISRTHGRPLL